MIVLGQHKKLVIQTSVGEITLLESTGLVEILVSGEKALSVTEDLDVFAHGMRPASEGESTTVLKGGHDAFARLNALVRRQPG